jgi:hypothetical protein
MLAENPLLILVIIFAAAGLLVFRMLREPAAPADRDSHFTASASSPSSENSASKRGA